MGESGSPLYALTWKRLAMPSAPHVCQLAASVRLTGDTAFSGWPTAATRDGKGGYQGGRIRFGKLSIDTLDTAAQLAAWPTPTETDSASSARHGYMKLGHDGTTLFDAARLAAWPTPLAGNADGSQAPKDASPTGKRADGSKATVSLPTIARLASWPTPVAEDGESSGARLSRGTADTLTAVTRLALGTIPIGSPAATGNSGQLNPAFSLWLMGLPSHWVLAAPLKASRARKSSARQETASSRKPRQSS